MVQKNFQGGGRGISLELFYKINWEGGYTPFFPILGQPWFNLKERQSESRVASILKWFTTFLGVHFVIL